MKTLSDYSDYSGIDHSNEISLYEYGLLCKEDNENNIHCLYGIGSTDECNYDTFGNCWLSKSEIIDLFNELDKPGLLSYTGQTEKEFLNLSPIQQLSDLKSYFGIENIFGSTYNSFEIENN